MRTGLQTLPWLLTYAPKTVKHAHVVLSLVPLATIPVTLPFLDTTDRNGLYKGCKDVT